MIIRAVRDTDKLSGVVGWTKGMKGMGTMNFELRPMSLVDLMGFISSHEVAKARRGIREK